MSATSNLNPKPRQPEFNLDTRRSASGDRAYCSSKRAAYAFRLVPCLSASVASLR